jgi:hypothetical protein
MNATEVPISEERNHDGGDPMSTESNEIQETINTLRAGLDERIADYLACYHPDMTLADVADDIDGPLDDFVREIVYAESGAISLPFHLVITDADPDSLDGFAAIISTSSDARERAVPSRLVYVDWETYGTAGEGARALAEEFYAAFEQVAAAEIS